MNQTPAKSKSDWAREMHRKLALARVRRNQRLDIRFADPQNILTNEQFFEEYELDLEDGWRSRVPLIEEQHERSGYE
jgi:hypothetical protein